MLSRAIACLLLWFSSASLAMAQSAQLKRGDYLVNGVMTCGNCHTPKGPAGEIEEKAFAGGIEFDLRPFKVTASNITPDKETGIGSWSAADIKKLLRTGVRPDGVAVAPIMPTGFYGILTESDLDAIVVYLKSLKPLKNKVPDPVYRFPVQREVFPGSEKPYTAANLKTKVARGFYQSTIAHCMECHTPVGPKGHEYANSLGKGGLELKGAWGISISRNITQSVARGLGKWTDAEIKRAITEGISKDGTRLAPPMGFHYYSRMTARDLDDLVAYLRTVPAKD